MGWVDWINPVYGTHKWLYDQLGKKINLPGAGTDTGDWLSGSSAPGAGEAADFLRRQGKYGTVGPNPYQGNYTALINQLTQTAQGKGESQAGMAYRDASDRGMGQLNALANAGGTSTGALNAANAATRLHQGMAAGYGQARAQEMTMAQNALTQALSGASQSDFQRQNSNQDAFLRALMALLGTKSNAAQYGSAIIGGVQGAATGGATLGG